MSYGMFPRSRVYMASEALLSVTQTQNTRSSHKHASQVERRRNPRNTWLSHSRTTGCISIALNSSVNILSLWREIKKLQPPLSIPGTIYMIYTTNTSPQAWCYHTTWCTLITLISYVNNSPLFSLVRYWFIVLIHRKQAHVHTYKICIRPGYINVYHT